MSLVLLSSNIGQINSSSDDLCGPFQHIVDRGNVEGSIPREMKSAGLDWDGAGPHIAEDVYSWMMVILLPKDVFQLVNGPCIHVSTIEESVHRCCAIFTQQVRA